MPHLDKNHWHVAATFVWHLEEHPRARGVARAPGELTYPVLSIAF
jgi:hypothetical protein